MRTMDMKTMCTCFIRIRAREKRQFLWMEKRLTVPGKKIQELQELLLKTLLGKKSNLTEGKYGSKFFLRKKEYLKYNNSSIISFWACTTVKKCYNTIV